MARLAGQHVRQLEHAVPGEPGDPEDLALVDIEVDAVQPVGAGIPELEHDRRVGSRRHRGPEVRIDILADHQLGQAAVIDLRHGQRRDYAAGSQHGHAVGDLEDLVEAVRDVENAGASALHLPHHLEQPLDLVVWQHGRRLVEHEHAAPSLPALHRAGNRDDRPLDGRGLGQRSMDVELDIEALEDPVGLPLLLAPADAPRGSADEAAAKREVVHRVELVDEAEVLVDEPKPGRHVVSERELFALELGARARVGRVISGQRLDQGRFARAVLSDEGVDFAGADVERHIGERASAGERLGEAHHA